MNRISWVKARNVSIWATVILSAWLASCAYTPDNFAFTKLVLNKEGIPKVKRVALLDVPTPTGIWLGDPEGFAVGFINPLISLAGATHEGHTISSNEKFSEVTRDEMRNWLEKAGIEVTLLKADRVKKSKMLKNYDQFKEVDVDAILEIAPIRVGFVPDHSELRFTEGALSPDVALAYRLITPDENKVLIESNVFYSSFNDQYAPWLGTKSVGPYRHIFKDSDSVEEQPEEAARRLHYAIKGATELISKRMLNTDSVSFITPSGKPDLSGVYEARITRELKPGEFNSAASQYYCFNGKRKFYLELKQNTNTLIDPGYAWVEGSFLSGFKGRIQGTFHYNDRLIFNYWTKRCKSYKNGEWVLNSDGSSLEGYGWSEIKWELDKGFE